MANLCDYVMLVKGKTEGIEKFYKALTQSSSEAWMGRGADADIIYENGGARITGYCKWSIQSALIDGAISMQKQKNNNGEGIWYWGDEVKDVVQFITLFEACEKWGLNMEVFSWEPGCCFSEHYKYENGDITDECIDYEEEYDEKTEEYIPVGGFEPNFNLADVV